MDQFLTYKKPKIGPAVNFTAYIYIYIYIYAVVSLSGTSLGFWGLITWSKFFF